MDARGCAPQKPVRPAVTNAAGVDHGNASGARAFCAAIPALLCGYRDVLDGCGRQHVELPLRAAAKGSPRSLARAAEVIGQVWNCFLQSEKCSQWIAEPGTSIAASDFRASFIMGGGPHR